MTSRGLPILFDGLLAGWDLLVPVVPAFQHAIQPRALFWFQKDPERLPAVSRLWASVYSCGLRYGLEGHHDITHPFHLECWRRTIDPAFVQSQDHITIITLRLSHDLPLLLSQVNHFARN
jgi:hypothetical protein